MQDNSSRSIMPVLLIAAIVPILLILAFSESNQTGVIIGGISEGKHDPLWEEVEMRVTAYCPCSKCCGIYSDGRTANNYKIKENDVLVAAPPDYPFGTEIIIPGYNNNEPVIVRDRGGAINGDRLDVYFPTHQEALNWGVRYLTVRVKKH